MEYSGNLGESFVSVVQGKSGKVGNQFTYGIKACCMGPLDLIGLWILLSHLWGAGDANASSPRISWPDAYHTKALWWNSKLYEHICSFDSLRPSDAYMLHQLRQSLAQIMAWCLFDAKPLSEPMLYYCQFDLKEQTSFKLDWKLKHFHSRKCNWINHLENVSHFVLASICCGPITKPFWTHQGSLAVKKIFFFFISQ